MWGSVGAHGSSEYFEHFGVASIDRFVFLHAGAPMQKRAVSLLIAFWFLNLLAGAEAPFTPKYLEAAAAQTANTLVQAIQANLPAGWTASLERETS